LIHLPTPSLLFLKIEVENIKEQLGEDEKFRFKPSSAAIHPLTGELYIIASVNHVLVILNKDHSVKNATRSIPVYLNSRKD